MIIFQFFHSYFTLLEGIPVPFQTVVKPFQNHQPHIHPNSHGMGSHQQPSGINTQGVR